MKKIIILALLLRSLVFAQTPINDLNWQLNNTFSDEFNNTRKNVWTLLNGYVSPRYTNRIQNVSYGTENGRSFLRLVGNRENGINYVGGIETGYGNGYSGLGYGYYEIEAKIVQTAGIQTGLFPAFWTIHSKDSEEPPYWYEELDIFEVGNCQVRNKEHCIGYHHATGIGTASVKIEGFKYNVDMSLWHKYALEWLPCEVIFYLDDEPFFSIKASNGDSVPYHQNTNLLINLQIDDQNGCLPPNNYSGILGYFDVNYFRYYTLNCSNEIINENQGNAYNFNNYVYNIKRSCIFKNTAIPSNKKIIMRVSDFVELKENFEVPLGAEFAILPTECH